MNTTDKDALVALAKKAQRAKDQHIALGMSNVANLSPEERVELDVSYRQAQIARDQAEKAYQDAIDRVVKGFPADAAEAMRRQNQAVRSFDNRGWRA